MPSSAGHSGAASPGRRPRRHRRRRMTTVNETSAGGLVVNGARTHAVLIGRLDRNGSLLWSLPKGHIEEGESREQTAVREVKEETGISARVLDSLGTIDYWFVADGRRVHKTVHHFLLEATGGELSTADTEVTEVAWVAFAELADVLAYADERKLAAKAREALAGRD
ncbi:NUDIX hydrolase [Haloechinothrix sp. YIM 98757]|uniref:NUDIX hydrolase n=1 Tax=Haloechinothrix aidingensis TaxID=2752311 RepID=A0A838A6L1_9PSEU|nr:NUDIX hydrolase [Haloechinothrix aidingensis]MBA0124017.1 NUDIX hydrolase [Haloechinothrix aidingensis]